MSSPRGQKAGSIPPSAKLSGQAKKSRQVKKTKSKNTTKFHNKKFKPATGWHFSYASRATKTQTYDGLDDDTDVYFNCHNPKCRSGRQCDDCRDEAIDHLYSLATDDCPGCTLTTPCKKHMKAHAVINDYIAQFRTVEGFDHDTHCTQHLGLPFGLL